jgi:tRNA(fMet)-specific endonuclease VapC
MTEAVVDTDVASYLLIEHPLAERYLDALGSSRRVLSFMSVAELWAGAFSAHWRGRRRAELERFIMSFEIVYPDAAMCLYWARIRAEARATGRGLGPQDAWVAATALVIDAPLATNNRRDFQHIRQLRLLSS